MDIEAEVVTFEEGSVGSGHSPDAFPHGPGGFVKRGRLSQSLALFKVVVQQSHYRLADGETAAIEYRKNPLARLDEMKHLPRGVYLIKAGVSPRIRGQNQAFIRHNAQTIRH
jgi:hypothetical protein